MSKSEELHRSGLRLTRIACPTEEILMRQTLSTLCLICSVSTVWSAELPNGVYRVVENGQGKPVDRSIGGQVELGTRLTADFGEVSIWSTSNQNDRFRVWMKRTGMTDDRGQLAIFIDGVCEVVSSQGQSEGSDRIDLIADVRGEENVRKIAAVLETEVIERKHPGYQFDVHWRPLQEQFTLGEPVTLELSIRNAGTVPVYFVDGGQNRGARNNQFGFTAFSGGGYGKSVPDTGDPRHFGGMAALRTLKPGDVFRKQVDITKWFQFQNADSYRITGMYELEFYDRDFSPRVAWEDFATGRCTIRMVAAD